MMKNAQIAVGVDIGGTNIKIALVTEYGEWIDSQSLLVKRDAAHCAELDFICQAIKSFIDKHNVYPQLSGIGVASPGIVDTDNGVIEYAVNLGWNHVRLVEIMQNKLHLNVHLLSDSVAGAIGEQLYTAADLDHYMFICIGTGLGASLIQNGEAFNGAGGAINLGHMSIIHNGKQCNCGNTGCLEKYVSASALIERAKVDLNNNYNAFKSQELTPHHLFEAAENGDTYAISLFQETGQLLGMAIVNCIHLFGAHNYIIGGGVSQAGRYILDSAQREVKSRYKENEIRIIQSTVPTAAGVVGAAMYVFERGKFL
ncbi:glucokinase [Bacillus sp. J14TS2]|nr:glucokinase [Bacillus sp. J14TS2]